MHGSLHIQNFNQWIGFLICPSDEMSPRTMKCALFTIGVNLLQNVKQESTLWIDEKLERKKKNLKQKIKSPPLPPYFVFEYFWLDIVTLVWHYLYNTACSTRAV